MPQLRLRWLYLSTSFSFLLSGHLSSYPLFFSGNSRSRFRGLGCETPPPARFSVKIPERGEDDFCRNRLRHDLAGWNKALHYLCLRIGMTDSHLLLLPPFFLSVKASVTLNSSSKATAASKELPFLPLKPLITFVAPDENNCSRCCSLSSLFSTLRNTSSPHSGLSHLATFGRMVTLPIPHFGQGIECSLGGANFNASTSRVTCEVKLSMECIKELVSSVCCSICKSVFSQLPVRSTLATCISLTAS